MNNVRSTKKQPFCWQEKKILRLLRYRYNGAELQKLRNLYLTLTEIYSDFNGQDIKYYTETIAKYSGLSKAWIPKGLKIFEKLKVILVIEDKVGGKFKGKKLIFTPENLEEINIKTVTKETVIEKTVNGKTVTGETIVEEIVNGKTIIGKTVHGKSVGGFLKTSEDILLLEDNKRIEDINNTHTENRKVKKENLNNAPVEIQQILRKYCDLGLPEFDYKSDNYIFLEFIS